MYNTIWKFAMKNIFMLRNLKIWGIGKKLIEYSYYNYYDNILRESTILEVFW